MVRIFKDISIAMVFKMFCSIIINLLYFPNRTYFYYLFFPLLFVFFAFLCHSVYYPSDTWIRQHSLLDTIELVFAFPELLVNDVIPKCKSATIAICTSFIIFWWVREVSVFFLELCEVYWWWRQIFCKLRKDVLVIVDLGICNDGFYCGFLGI